MLVCITIEPSQPAPSSLILYMYTWCVYVCVCVIVYVDGTPWISIPDVRTQAMLLGDQEWTLMPPTTWSDRTMLCWS